MLERRAFLVMSSLASVLALAGACSVGNGNRPGSHRDTGGPPDQDVGSTITPPGEDAATVELPDGGTGTADNCGDGLDNTGDGLVDEGCSCSLGDWQYCWTGPPERRGVGACRDGVQQCQSFSAEFSSWGSCDGQVLPEGEVPADGIDQDCDGFDDGSSSSCAEFEDCGPNGADEDCNGYVDCEDPACATSAACGSSCAADEFACTDGIDEDCDGYADCNDPNCGSDAACVIDPPPPGCMRMFPFVAEVLCGDGRDNDCDGHIDCDDTDCHHPGSCGCPSTEGACTDGSDNDCDGSADCADTDCQTCTPGSTRWCDDPMYCHWGQQTCGSDGHWGTCVEVTTHAGSCTGVYYSASCCVEAGACCENYPTDHTSIGNCGGISTCTGG